MENDKDLMIGKHRWLRKLMICSKFNIINLSYIIFIFYKTNNVKKIKINKNVKIL